ncbi:MAG: T9SS type A sorting domain-containing protein [Bacteroidales bacterium]|nr:T9SS type A sorting domain-containing protein [Bacteroidales bacterium]
MKYFPIIILLIYSQLTFSQDIGGDYYVAPADHPETPGDDRTGTGSYSAPWATFQKAFDMARPGDTVYFRGGIYRSTAVSVITPQDEYYPRGYSGTAELPIRYFGYPNDVAAGNLPILDCSLHCSSIPPNPFGGIYNSAISLSYAEHIHFKDMEVRNVFQCDMVIDGAISAGNCANLTFEHLIVHNVGQRGYWIQGGAWGQFTDEEPTPFQYDTTRWINCDTYDLCDTLVSNPGNAADAWKTIHYKGNYVSWEGCRAWNYTDDGWDPTPINGATRVFKNCWAIAGDKYKDIDPTEDGVEKNGFKNNGLTDYPSVNYNTLTMTNCIAAFCIRGFYELNYRHNGLYYNNTAFKCDIGFAAPYAEQGYPRSSIYRNNIAYASTGLDPGLGQPYEVALMGYDYDESHNTWEWDSEYPYFVMSSEVRITDADFLLTDPTAVFAQLTSKRKSDGSLPDIRALNLASGSDLIDAGTDVGLAFNGRAPDIGAFEYGKDPDTGNLYPLVTITSPTSGSAFPVSEAIPVHVNATDPDGSISRVEFYYDETVKIGESSTAPWSFTWENPPVGKHGIKAVATDNDNAIATSLQVFVTVAPDSISAETENPEAGVLYPNPNDGNFTLVLPETLEMENDLSVISLEGREIYRDTMNANEAVKEFDFSYFKPGMYVLILSGSVGLLYHKFIKL